MHTKAEGNAIWWNLEFSTDVQIDLIKVWNRMELQNEVWEARINRVTVRARSWSTFWFHSI